MAPHMLPEAGVGAAVGEGVGAGVGEGVGAGVGGGAGVDTGMQNLHPLPVIVKSDDQNILSVGVYPEGPEVPE